MTGTIEITKPHANLLVCVPASDSGAMRRVVDCKRKCEVGFRMAVDSIDIHWGQLVDMGLVTVTSGYTKRTIEGDKAVQS